MLTTIFFTFFIKPENLLYIQVEESGNLEEQGCGWDASAFFNGVDGLPACSNRLGQLLLRQAPLYPDLSQPVLQHFTPFSADDDLDVDLTFPYTVRPASHSTKSDHPVQIHF